MTDKQTSAIVLDKDNPWPALSAFEETGQRFFNGRQGETATLRRLAQQASLTVLFGKSGLGKTSLLKAGLFPQLRADHHLPVYVRLNVQDRERPLVEQLATAYRAEVVAHRVDALAFKDGETIWHYLHRRDLEIWSAQNHLLTPVFVLDQFEEIFTLGLDNADAVAQLRIDLADLVENRIPAPLAIASEQDAVTTEMLNLPRQPYKLLLSFREDFLPTIESWKLEMPSLMRNRLRLLPMSGDQAFAAVHETAPSLAGPEIAADVVRFVANANWLEAPNVMGSAAESREPLAGNAVLGAQTTLGDLVVEPALLSLVCHGLNERRKREGKETFDHTLLRGTAGAIIEDFYHGAIADLPVHVRRFIETELITERGFRKPCAIDDAGSKYGITDDELRTLVNRRLLRIEPYQGIDRVEIIHDVVTPVIRQSREQQRQMEDVRRQEQARHQAELTRAREAELTKTRELAQVREEELAQAAQLAAAREAILMNSEKLAAVQKRRLRVLRRFSAVTLACAVVALLSYRKASTARDQQQTDRVYFSAVSEARDQLQTRPQHALLLAVQALKLRNPTLIDLGAENIVRQGLSLVGGRALAAHSGEIRSVAVTSKSDWLITGSADGTVRRWNLKSATPELNSEELNNENRAAGSANEAALKDRPDAAIRIRPLVEAAVSPDDQWVAMGTESGAVKLRSLTSTTMHQLQADTYLAPGGDRQTISALAFVRNGRSLVAGFASGVARLWNLEAPSALPMLLALSASGGTGARQISQIESSGDGQWLALASGDGAIDLWNLSGPHPRWIEMNQVSRISAIAISTDSRSLFTGSADGFVDRWQLGDDDRVTLSKRVKVAGVAVLTLAISFDRRWLVTGGQDGAIRLWNEDLTLVGELQKRGEGRISLAEFSPDDRWLVTVSADGPVRLWNMRDQGSAPHRSRASIALLGHDEYVRDVAFSRDGHWLVTGGSDATARLWDLLAPDPADPTVRHRGHETGIQAMMISSDLRWLAAATVNGLELTDWAGAHSHRVLRPDACDAAATAERRQLIFSAVKLSANSRWLAALSSCSAVGSERPRWDLDLYDTSAPQPKHVAVYHNVSAVDFSSDSDWLIAGHMDGLVSVLELQAGLPRTRTLAAGPVASPITAVAVGGSKRHVAAVSADGTVRLWNMTVDPAKAVLTESFGKDALASIAISTDDRRLVVAARDPQNVATVWDLQAADVEASCTTLAHHSKALTTVAISPDSKLLITASRDGTARLYDLSDGFTAAHGKTSGCSPSADGRPNAVFVFDGHSGPISAIRISPDSRRLITIDMEGIGRVWSLREPSPKHVILSTMEDPIREAVFSADGNVIMTASVDGTIRSADLDVSALIRRAREAIGRNLSPAEWCQSLSPLKYEKTFVDLPVWRPGENINCVAADASESASIAARFRRWLAPAQTTTQ